MPLPMSRAGQLRKRGGLQLYNLGVETLISPVSDPGLRQSSQAGKATCFLKDLFQAVLPRVFLHRSSERAREKGKDPRESLCFGQKA